MSRIELPDVTKYVENGQPVLFGDEHFMRAALRCAENAAAAGEVPVGAVAVKDGIIIAKAWNQVELLKDATAHAEVLLISSISAALNDWRMEDVDIYVTKEPCAMCAGAMVNARVRRVIFGLSDPRSGAAGGALDVTGFPGMLHQVEVKTGVLADECGRIMKQFFQSVREKKKN
ncbi:MAG: tRNA adenosine(34) deaminase TadA [Lentisphaeria bacterium]|nr:tRNA adenosine(34) deaminase TadA [Lentisphaeria bacterium]MBR3708392.1 tRNA adenosine(34) deaminase TadA [Lentisphaeria bacterium]MBR4076531.1 tRNA adenosine(34) deaminase TadA [Lentisphaeria bacterium]